MRIFKHTRYTEDEWRFGPDARNIEGDFYVNGVYIEPSLYTLEDLARYPELKEVTPYPEHMLVDEEL